MEIEQQEQKIKYIAKRKIDKYMNRVVSQVMIREPMYL